MVKCCFLPKLYLLPNIAQMIGHTNTHTLNKHTFMKRDRSEQKYEIINRLRYRLIHMSLSQSPKDEKMCGCAYVGRKARTDVEQKISYTKVGQLPFASACTNNVILWVKRCGISVTRL